MNNAHIKSNITTEYYIKELFSRDDFIWVLGKPFGIQELCKSLNLSDEIIGGGFLKPPDTDKFAYIDESLGNALGTAIGIALANPEKYVLCFISDAQLYMGSTLEAMIAMQTLKIKNILLVIDYNKLGSRGKIPDFNWYIFGDIPVFEVLPRARLWNKCRMPQYTGNSCVWVVRTFDLIKLKKFLTENVI